jgi:hypothetical protein
VRRSLSGVPAIQWSVSLSVLPIYTYLYNNIYNADADADADDDDDDDDDDDLCFVLDVIKHLGFFPITLLS